MIHDLVRYQYDNSSSLPREHVLLVSLGCSWGKCAFCDYQDDKSSSVLACDILNKKVLSQVRGQEIGSTCLDVTCSASYTELPFTTMNYIRQTCEDKGIKTLILEGHYIYRDTNHLYTEFFGSRGIEVLFRCGVETFDENIREKTLRKGLPGVTPEQLSQYFQWVNIMFGMDCQTIDQLKKDIEIALKYFKRINLSIYTTIPGGPKRDQAAIEAFYYSEYYKNLLSNPKIEIFDEWDDGNVHNVGHDIMTS